MTLTISIMLWICMTNRTIVRNGTCDSLSKRNERFLKQSCIALKCSMQSTPFGSSVECTKQENAFLNSSPHGPLAIPPRHGQSQLISPVTGSYADSCSCCSEDCPPSFDSGTVSAASSTLFAIVGGVCRAAREVSNSVRDLSGEIAIDCTAEKEPYFPAPAVSCLCLCRQT